ncbi:MAG: gamma-glutamyl-gamma-aminobutyrate hydrolase family protein [Firmicutes bacterium]|nr:gamma-glutamyl-gamma-aminobutyrate hydrolase family protein [Bacillota bacterium]
MRPVIAMTIREFPEFAGYKMRRANAVTVEQAGGLPLFLPPVHTAQAVKEQLALADALILTGGGDPDPALFGETAVPVAQVAEPERDAYELLLIRTAWEMGLPMLGICRGMQMINIALGGDIYQDLAYAGISGIEHAQKEDMAVGTHPVHISEPSLARLLGGDILVNSSHHQAVRRLPPCLKEAGRAPDGVIEAYVAAEEDRYAVGLQWHPELLQPVCGIFRQLTEYAEKRRRQHHD